MTEDTRITTFEPANIDQAMKLSETLAKSALIPSALRNKPADILIVMMKGRELGLTSMQSFAGIHVIEGKAVLSAELLMGLVIKRRDICEYFVLVESNEKLATYKTKRVGCPEVSLTYTIEQATVAGLVNKDNWKKHRATMLRWRAGAALAKGQYADLTLGLVTEDEAEEIVEREVNTPSANPEAVRAMLEGKRPPISIVDVRPGETEEQATARASDPVPAALPSPWERAQAMLKGAGIGKPATFTKAVTGKTKGEDVTEEDLLKLEAALSEQSEAAQP